ncbi:M56 family metallopeptidase [Flavobacterium ginsenosidimutans]|uniref:M56 family metallopeptidase n=1 Tax=Flavobacterium ginsenosidimutans TaxID=687844 RepID=A0ABZ2Q3H4_9FLAO|nr:M56 family metallopeptidase [Flavobacterium ginsenosidimutans]KAF2336795.1 peptidase M56 [Flavobacterium ginsenosidimutans]
MEALFIFILKSSGLLAMFYFAYILLLRKETFFNSSRWFLIAGLITSVVLPFVVYTKVIWVEAPPTLAPDPVVVRNTVENIPTSNHDVIAYEPQYKPTTINVVEEESFEINWDLVLALAYGIGFLAFMTKFALDFYSLNSVLKGKKVEQQDDFKFIDVNENIAPFSYFDYIVYNSSLYTAAELENILEHEKVHSDQKHTVDVLISRIFCILFWFNPIVWLYKKAILQNLEFIADSEAAKKISDKKAYQYTLLKITTHETCVAITNHFYQSLIKKRIVMLNKNQSNKRNYWKYSAVIPALGAFILLFQIKTIAQEKKQDDVAIIKRDTVKDSDETIKITKNTTDKELNELPGKLKANHNLDVEISDVKRNTKEELTAIQIKVKSDSGKKQTIKIDGDQAIKDCELAIGTDENGAKAIVINTDKNFRTPIIIRNERVIVRNGDIVPPTPPSPPSFPSGPLPPAPAIDMSKMPKPPVAPKNPNDKVAMSKFEKEMEAFEKQMESFEPQMDAYEKQIEAIMSQRSADYEKEMAKYEIAMEKFSANMEKFNYDFKFKFGDNSQDYENSMKEYEQDMKQYELDMKQHEKDMKQHAKDMKQHAKDMKQHEKDMKAWEKENKKA